MNSKGHGKGSEATNNKDHFVSVSYDCTVCTEYASKYGSKIGQALARCSQVRLVLISVHNRINSKVNLSNYRLLDDASVYTVYTDMTLPSWSNQTAEHEKRFKIRDTKGQTAAGP